MDKFNHCRHQMVVRALITQRLSHEQQHGGTHAFTPGPNDVIADRSD